VEDRQQSREHTLQEILIIVYFVKALQEHQELAIFLALALGFFIGRLKIGSFSLGTVVGTLLAGVLIGRLDIKVPAIVKTIFVDLFLFTTGYKVGPAVLPHVTAILFGRYVLKMNPLILLGACSGAGTITAALRAIQDEAHSKLPALGYTVPYAIGNIRLTAWGPVIVVMMA
jgi:uncharacterized transporter YbjL